MAEFRIHEIIAWMENEVFTHGVGKGCAASVTFVTAILSGGRSRIRLLRFPTRSEGFIYLGGQAFMWSVQSRYKYPKQQ